MIESTTPNPMPSVLKFKVLAVAVFSFLLVIATTLFFLSRNLPEETSELSELPAAGFSFAFGSGHPEKDYVVVDEFRDGFALLSSGAASIQADQLKVLRYTWLPQGPPGEFSFFWRQKGSTTGVVQAEILATGESLLNLSTQPAWKGEIVEFGFLVAGDTENPVKIGQVQFLPDDLNTRINLLWDGWTSYELRSQQSINFLQGGAHQQFVTLPALVIVWLLLSLVLLKLLPGKLAINMQGERFYVLAIALFMAGWMLLDLRWTQNSYMQASELVGSFLHTNEEQRSRNDLDGEIYKYVQQLKKDVLSPQVSNRPNRILIIGDDNAVDYFLVRAKYHLLPDSAHVAAGLGQYLMPKNLDYVIFFGQPSAIANVPGWSTNWQAALSEINRSQWGVVYKVNP
jgi:hypothetical protein